MVAALLSGHATLVAAVVAGTAIAGACGLVGSVVVLRGQVFVGDALSHVAFTGALAGLAFGIDLRLGLYGGCVAFGLLLGILGWRRVADDSVIGSVFAWVLGLGALFLSIFTSTSSGTADGGTSGIAVLFGTILGLSPKAAATDAAIALAVMAVTLAMARPLLFVSIDPDVARSRGVPIRTISIVFMIVVGVTAGVAAQAVGALLLLGLLAAPAGAAHRLTARPLWALALSAGLAVVAMWVGLAVAVIFPAIPPSFGIVGAATLCFGGAIAWSRRDRFSLPGHRALG